MSLVSQAIRAFEAAPVPDVVRRGAISVLVSRAKRELRAAPPDATRQFAERMAACPIAQETRAANKQHYEVPTAFFHEVLGPRLKYSCCLYATGAESLAMAEIEALRQTCANADLQDGQEILELGCGWGSLTLWMAEHLPRSQITAVSNSATQRAYIEAQARARQLGNVRVVTADMNTFMAGKRFDRIVSVEMFEHMSNWRALFERCGAWLKPDARLFIHVFVNREVPYRFQTSNADDWIAQHFFSGGVMPSMALAASFPDLFQVEREWWWNGKNYQRTADDWLANFDANISPIRPVFRATYGAHAGVWLRRWRLFFMATSEMFGHASGETWGVAQYRLKRA